MKLADARFVGIYKGEWNMRAKYTMAVAVMAGIVIGIVGASVMYARQAKTAPGYVISEVDAITDLPTVQKYGAKVGETLAPFNHRFVVSGASAQPLDGEAPKGIVVIQFDSAAKAREWYDSAAYQAIKGLRTSSTHGRMFIVEGLAAQ